MSQITVRTQDELNRAAKEKYDQIYPEGELKDELIKLVERTNSTGKQLVNAGALLGAAFLTGPLALVTTPIGIWGAAKTIKNAKLGNYMIRSTSDNIIYFERKK